MLKAALFLFFSASPNKVYSASLQFCPPALNSDADFTFVLQIVPPAVLPGLGGLLEEPPLYAVALLVSPDGGILWDKTCG